MYQSRGSLGRGEKVVGSFCCGGSQVRCHLGRITKYSSGFAFSGGFFCLGNTAKTRRVGKNTAGNTRKAAVQGASWQLEMGIPMHFNLQATRFAVRKLAVTKFFPCFPAKHLGTGRTNLTNLGLFLKIWLIGSLIQDQCSFSTFWTGKVFFLMSYNQFGYERRRVILYIKLHPRSLWWGVYSFVHSLGKKKWKRYKSSGHSDRGRSFLVSWRDWWCHPKRMCCILLVIFGECLDMSVCSKL